MPVEHFKVTHVDSSHFISIKLSFNCSLGACRNSGPIDIVLKKEYFVYFIYSMIVLLFFRPLRSSLFYVPNVLRRAAGFFDFAEHALAVFEKDDG